VDAQFEYSSGIWLNIFCGSRSEEAKDRIDLIRRRFEDIWASRDPNLSVHRPGDDALDPFIRVTRVTDRPYGRSEENVSAHGSPDCPAATSVRGERV
jgi:hypothetical protein